MHAQSEIANKKNSQKTKFSKNNNKVIFGQFLDKNGFYYKLLTFEVVQKTKMYKKQNEKAVSARYRIAI